MGKAEPESFLHRESNLSCLSSPPQDKHTPTLLRSLLSSVFLLRLHRGRDSIPAPQGVCEGLRLMYGGLLRSDQYLKWVILCTAAEDR